jgi:hypothetical protein
MKIMVSATNACLRSKRQQTCFWESSTQRPQPRFYPMSDRRVLEILHCWWSELLLSCLSLNGNFSFGSIDINFKSSLDIHLLLFDIMSCTFSLVNSIWWLVFIIKEWIWSRLRNQRIITFSYCFWFLLGDFFLWGITAFDEVGCWSRLSAFLWSLRTDFSFIVDESSKVWLFLLCSLESKKVGSWTMDLWNTRRPQMICTCYIPRWFLDWLFWNCGIWQLLSKW